MKHNPIRYGHGPFRAEQLKSGDPYELSNGHPIECLPSGGRHAKANLNGGLALGTDPDVDSAGFDAGYTPEPGDLRAPDIAVGNVPDAPGWVKGVPPLAVEYADTGQDEQDLHDKIDTLLAAGTQYIWVVRMNGPRHVEVYQSGQPPRLLHPGEQLEAPGVLRNPVPVEALYDPDAAQNAALRNLLQRQGYPDLNAVRNEGHEQGHEQGHESGLEKGLETGLEKGRHEGRTEEGITLVLRLLTRRLGNLNPTQESDIRHLPLDRIEALAVALLDFSSSDELDGWLETNTV